MMAAVNSPDQRYPFTSNSKKGDGMPETLPPGDHSFSQQVMYNSPAVCGVVAQFPHQVRSSSMYESTPSSFSGEHQVPSPTSVGHQQMHMGSQHHHQPQKVQDEQSGQAMVTMQSMQGAPSIYPPSYLDTMDARSRYSPDFPHFSQAGPFASHEAAMDMVQTSRTLAARPTILPYNGEGRASTSTQGRREFPWTERHTEVLRQGKRAGKSAPEIVKDLYQIDGVERTPNLVSKRWGKMRQGCINKHDMDSIVEAVCPDMVRKVYGELSNLDFAQLPNLSIQIVEAERQVKGILRKHMVKGVQEVVLKLVSNDASFSA